jgi:transposase
VVDVLHEDPFSSQVFCFCNRGRDKLKILFDHTNGFWLWYRRLERQRFWWPPAALHDGPPDAVLIPS